MVKEHMDALFGESADTLRENLEPLKPYERELAIVEALAQSLKRMGANFVLPFRFKNERGNRTSHYLIFVSKHFKGYETMKEVMAKESTTLEQGVPSFEYAPATLRQPLLFELSRPLDDLADMLLNDYVGQTVTRREIYEKHSVDRPYISDNYREVLLKLEEMGKIVTNPPAAQRRKYKGRPGLDESNVRITFPK